MVNEVVNTVYQAASVIRRSAKVMILNEGLTSRPVGRSHTVGIRHAKENPPMVQTTRHALAGFTNANNRSRVGERGTAIGRVSPPHNVAGLSASIVAGSIAATLWGGGHTPTRERLPLMRGPATIRGSTA